MFGLIEVTLEEEEFGVEETEDEEETQGTKGSGITMVKDENIHLLTDDETCIVYMKCLLKLTKTNVGSSCTVKGCACPVSVRTNNVGSEIYMFWVSLFVFQNQLNPT